MRLFLFAECSRLAHKTTWKAWCHAIFMLPWNTYVYSMCFFYSARQYIFQKENRVENHGRERKKSLLFMQTKLNFSGVRKWIANNRKIYAYLDYFIWIQCIWFNRKCSPATSICGICCCHLTVHHSCASVCASFNANENAFIFSLLYF